MGRCDLKEDCFLTLAVMDARGKEEKKKERGLGGGSLSKKSWAMP